MLWLFGTILCGCAPSTEPAPPEPAEPAPAAPAPPKEPFSLPKGLVFRPAVSRQPNRPLHSSDCPLRAPPPPPLTTCIERMVEVEGQIGHNPEACAWVKSGWSCFTNREQHMLSLMKLKSYDQLAKAVPPVEALRFRVERWRNRSEVREIVKGAFGEALVGDDVSRDVLYEAWLLLALARIPAEERTPEQEGWWAEAAYHLSVVLADPLAEELRPWQPKMIESAEQMLEIATTGPLPPVVEAAVAAARAGQAWSLPEAAPEP